MTSGSAPSAQFVQPLLPLLEFPGIAAFRRIKIEGVARLHGATHEVISDSNELVTFASLSLICGGDIYLENVRLENVKSFLTEVENIGGGWEEIDGKVRFFHTNALQPSNITTAPEPGFKTDWQGPWAILMTQAEGISTIHETIYEKRFGYVAELKKMGAKIQYHNPKVADFEKTYNFNYNPKKTYRQAIKIQGPTPLHNAALNITDLRAGATVVIAALIAKGESIISGVEHIDRGYEKFDERLKKIGADISTIEE